MTPRWSRAVLVVSALGFVPSPAQGQSVRGMVAEQLTLAPAHGAVVVLLRVTEGDGLESVGMTTTDEAGVFALPVPGTGTFRIQADLDGLVTPLSSAFDVRAGGTDVQDLALLLPSPLLHAALECRVEAGENTAPVVGFVRDPEAGVPLPDALITATWQTGRMVHRAEAETGPTGLYRICGIPAGAGRVRFSAQLMGRSNSRGELDVVDIKGPSIVFHDLAISLASHASGPADVVQERILLEAAAHQLGDLQGQVRDQMSGTPIPFAVVRIKDTSHQAVTDQDGRFVFPDIEPATYTLEVRNLGYLVTADPVEVPAGKDVFLGLRIAPQVMELEGLEVTTRSAVEQVTRLTPFRRDIVYGDVMAQEEHRGALAYEILRRSSPGLRVTQIVREAGPPTLCIKTNRRIQELYNAPPVESTDLLGTPSRNQCDNPEVVVDGVRVPDGPDFLLRTPASEIESIEFMTPVHAQTAYGVFGGTSNGVVVVFTRGKGPYASPLRNRR
jgi:hypothetical protein